MIEESDDDVDDEYESEPENPCCILQSYLRAAAQIANEFLGHERSPADQAAVDVRLRKQFPGVSGFDAAPVEDRQIPRSNLSRAPTRARMNACTSWVCCGVAFLPRAYRPHGFVGEHGVRQSGDPGRVEYRVELTPHHVFGLTALALLQGFPCA